MTETGRPEGLLTRLHHLRASLPPTAQRIAGYIADNAAEVVRMSITELAEQSGASEGSVIGLCRRVGVSGFQELKIVLAQDLVEPVKLIQEDLHEGDDNATVIDKIFLAHAATLEDTRRLLSAGQVAAAVALLDKARRIDCYGIGSSAPIAEDLAYRLTQLGRDARPVVDSHVQAVSAAMAGHGVAVITISHSGSTVETVTATRHAKEAGAATIGITRLGKSPLSRHCDIVLHTVANETRYRPEATTSRIAQLAIIDALVSCLALSDPARSITNLKTSARIISEKRY